MTSRQLPDRPNLEQLKKQAKSLLHAAQARDRGGAPALRRTAGILAASRSPSSPPRISRCTTRSR